MSIQCRNLLLRSCSQRKQLLSVFALIAMFYAAPQLQAATKNNDDDSKKNSEQPKKEKAQNDKEDKAAGEPSDAAVDAKAKKSTLTIVVRGGQKPTEQAEVRVTAVSGKTGEIRRFTNSQGQIVISALDAGTVEILVIAKGWKTSRRQITLKAGDNPLNIDLEPL